MNLHPHLSPRDFLGCGPECGLAQYPASSTLLSGGSASDLCAAQSAYVCIAQDLTLDSPHTTA